MRGLVTRLRRRGSTDPAPVPPVPPGPAGLEPQDPVAPPEPSFRDRGRLRRRLRYLRRVRELGFRDLGGLVFDLHRFGRSGDELVAQKLGALDAVDRELRALERALDDERPYHELREPGLAACPRCGAIHGSDARFCPACGTSLRGPLVVGGVGEVVAPPPAPVPSPASSAPPAPVATPAQAGSTPVAAALETEAPTQVIAPEPAASTESAATDDVTAVRRPDDSEA